MAVLKILVERQRALLQAEGQAGVTEEEALGKLLARYLGWDCRRILVSAADALAAAGCNEVRDAVLELLTRAQLT